MAKSKRKKLTEQLDKLCLTLVRMTTGYRCQRCGKKITGSNSHQSHIVPKGNGASWCRFDLLNIQHLCMPCHLHWWHKSPTEAGIWFAKNWPYLFDYLAKYRGGKPSKITTVQMELLLEQYKQKESELSDELRKIAK